MGHLLTAAVIILLIALLISGLTGGGKEEEIICPNPNCGYRGPGKRDGGSSGCLLLILLLCGLLPGILYLLLCGTPGVICPRCGMRIR